MEALFQSLAQGPHLAETGILLISAEVALCAAFRWHVVSNRWAVSRMSEVLPAWGVRVSVGGFGAWLTAVTAYSLASGG
jgi:hypothetical protein